MGLPAHRLLVGVGVCQVGLVWVITAPSGPYRWSLSHTMIIAPYGPYIWSLSLTMIKAPLGPYSSLSCTMIIASSGPYSSCIHF